MDIKNITTKLKKIPGLNNVKRLTKKDIAYLSKNEEPRNLGIHECLACDYVFMITHDSSFRNPSQKIVVKKKGRVYFPPIKFKELKSVNAISSSPGIKVHEYLIKRFKLKLKDEATLIIGFDI